MRLKQFSELLIKPNKRNMYKYNYPISERQPTDQQQDLLESINCAEKIKVNLCKIVELKQGQYDFLVNTTSSKNVGGANSLISNLKKKVNFQRSELQSKKKEAFGQSSRTGSSGKDIKSTKNNCSSKGKNKGNIKSHRIENQSSLNKGKNKSSHRSDKVDKIADEKFLQNPQELPRTFENLQLSQNQNQDLYGNSDKIDQQIYKAQYPKFSSRKQNLKRAVNKFERNSQTLNVQVTKPTKGISSIYWQQKIQLLQQLQKAMHLNLQLQQQNKKMKSMVKEYRKYISFLQDLNCQLKQETVFWINRVSRQECEVQSQQHLKQHRQAQIKQSPIIKDVQLLKFLDKNKRQNIQLKLKKHKDQYYWTVKEQEGLKQSQFPAHKIDQEILVKLPLKKQKFCPYSETQMKKLMSQLSILKEKGQYQRQQIVNLKFLKEIQESAPAVETKQRRPKTQTFQVQDTEMKKIRYSYQNKIPHSKSCNRSQERQIDKIKKPKRINRSNMVAGLS